MPLPKVVGRLNKVGINRLTGRFGGRVPPFAMVIHRGRRSGREYHTPIFAFPCDGGFLVALTYGRDTDWERNVRAGGGELIYRSRRYRLGPPAVVGQDRAGPCLPGIVRFILRLTRVDDFLHFSVAPAA